jgi:phosphatidylglycerol---prolipoprotein diacylglyceryl transferase
MHPELFKLPFVDMTVKSYGLMVVLGFVLAVLLIRKMCKRVNIDHEQLINAGFYTFIVGVVGSRIFHVIHYYENFDSVWEMLAIWRGGLELLGGVIPAILFLLWYLKHNKIDIAISLDIFATALMAGVAFGRIGCFLNGCCYGLPTDATVGVAFPYGSIPYHSQAYPDPARERPTAILDLPAEYYGYVDANGEWVEASQYNKYNYELKPEDMLSPEQEDKVSQGGPYVCREIHPTQLYSSVAAFINCGLLAAFWYNWGSGQQHMRKRKFPAGTTGALMLILYSLTRFGIESLRGDNPYEISFFTVSQLLSMAMFLVGIIMFAALTAKKENR